MRPRDAMVGWPHRSGDHRIEGTRQKRGRSVCVLFFLISTRGILGEGDDSQGVKECECGVRFESQPLMEAGKSLGRGLSLCQP